jgi:hypothetical protein
MSTTYNKVIDIVERWMKKKPPASGVKMTDKPYESTVFDESARSNGTTEPPAYTGHELTQRYQQALPPAYTGVQSLQPGQMVEYTSSQTRLVIFCDQTGVIHVFQVLQKLI